MYFRLRGTNLGGVMDRETDGECNPLKDELQGANNRDKDLRRSLALFKSALCPVSR